MAGSYDDNKIVSIEFDNKDFESNVQKTINTIDALNDATSEKNLKGDGLAGLAKAFSNLSGNATADIDQINSKLSDTSAYNNLSQSINDTSNEFSTLQVIGIGALLAIGETAVDVAGKITRTLVAGIRDGWNEYNLIMDSTQTILANTQRYGTTLDDVTGALDVLNEYADKTIYNFSQMTRNIGLFTTAGMNLEDSVTAIKGMANLGAVFGADNAAMARATYQISQAMSSGYVKLKDWMSMENAGMGGKLLQEELIKTAAIMSGQSVDAFKEYIGYSKGFRNTLEKNWLTADIYLETMRKFAGESREYWESLKAADGSRLYTDEEIDELMKTAAAAEEAATKVRTFRMMIESLMESIGSGWSTTFRLLIGDLEQAKEFWTPINNLLTTIVGNVSDYRNNIIKSWADIYRNMAVEDMMTMLTAIGRIFEAIGTGISRAFGNTHSIANRIGHITEAIGDLATTMTLTDEEFELLATFVEGILSPLTLFGDIIYEIARTFFNASDAINEFDTRGDSLVDRMQGIRTIFLRVLGAIGNFVKGITNAVKETGIISKAVDIFAKAVKFLYDGLYSLLNWIMPILDDLWHNYLIPFVGLFAELAIVSAEWVQNLYSSLQTLDIHLLEDFKNIFNGLKDIFIALTDPTIDVSDALRNFRETLSNTSIASIVDTIKDSLNGLWDSLKNTHLFQFFISAFEQFKQTDIGIWLIDIINNLKEAISTITGSFSNFNANGGFLGVIQGIIDYLIPLKEKIAGLGLVDSAIVILKSIFGTIGELISSVVHGFSESIGSVDFETNVETVVNRIIKAAEVLLVLGTIFGLSQLPGLLSKTAHNLLFQVIDPFSDMVMVIKERFKRDTWAVLGDFFKSLAIFTGVMAASILVLASLKDPYIAMPLLVTMFTGMAAIMAIIGASINSMFNTVKGAGITNLGGFITVILSLQQMSVIMGQMLSMIAVISGLAFLYSRADSETRATIAVAFGALAGLFLLISSMMLIITNQMTNNLASIASVGKALKSALPLYTGVLSSLLSIVMLVSISAAIMMKASGGDSGLLMAATTSLIMSLASMTIMAGVIVSFTSSLGKVNKGALRSITSFMGVLAGLGVVLSLVVTLLAKEDPDRVFGSTLGLIAIVGGFSVMAIAFAQFTNSLATVKLSNIGKMAATMAVMIGSLYTVIGAMAILDFIVKHSSTDAMWEALKILSAIVVGMMAIMGLMSYLQQINLIDTSKMLALAGSIAIMSTALIPISLGIALIAAIPVNDTMAAIRATEAIAIAIAALTISLGGITALWDSLNTNIVTIISAVAAIVILSNSLVTIAGALAIIAAIPDVKPAVIAMLSIMTAITAILGLFALLGGATFGVGPAILFAAAGAFLLMAQALVMIGNAILAVGAAMNLAGHGVKIFAEGMLIIQNLEPDRLLRSLSAIANFLPIMAASINANRNAITAAIVTLFRAIGTGISESIRIIFRTIGSLIVEGFAEQTRIILGLAVELFDVLMDTIHGLLVVLNDFLKAEIGPGGVLRELAYTLSDFILWLAGFLAEFMLTAVTVVIEGLANALENDGLITRLFNAVKHLMLSVKLALYNWLGAGSLGEWAAQLVIGFFGGLIDSFMQGASWFSNEMNDIIEDAVGERIDALDTLTNRIDSARTNTLAQFGTIFNNAQSNGISEVQAQLDALHAETDALDATLEEEQARQRAIAEEGDTSVYNPSRYYAAAAGVTDWNNSMSKTPSLLESITDAIGGSSGGLGGAISSIIGNGSGGGILSSLFGGQTPSENGESTGSSWISGLTNGILGGSGGLASLGSITDFANINEADFSNLNFNLDNTATQIDEISNPVITPVWDNSNVELGISDIESMWNNSDIDSFAIDAGNSILTSQAAQNSEDAISNGETTVNYTQYNYSPEALSPIQIYRDTSTLLRGRVNR